MRAVLFAGGAAPSLRPFTFTTPRSMLPVLGRSLLEAWVDRLWRVPVDEFLIVAEPGEERLRERFHDGRGCRFAFEFLPSEEFGSAGALKFLARRSPFFDERFIAVPADSWVSLDPRDLIALHESRKAAASFAGPVGVLEPRAVEALPDDPRAELNDSATGAAWAGAAETALYDGPVPCYPLESVADYWNLLMAALRGEAEGLAPEGEPLAAGVVGGPHVRVHPTARLTGPVRLGGGATVEDGATIEGPAWIGANCAVKSGAVLRRCVVEEATVVDGGQHLADRVIIGNRAVDASGAVTLLDAASRPETEEDRRMSEGLLRLAGRVARRAAPVVH